jgi:protein-disulfide isomerase
MVSQALTLALVTAAPGLDLSTLTSLQQEHFRQAATDEYCGCTSSLTLAGCLELRPSCRLAQTVGSVLINAAKTNAPASALTKFLSQGVMGPFCTNPVAFKVDGAPRLGKAKAPITVVEFADFRCSHCRHAAPLVHKAMEVYGNKAQLFYMPISLQDNPMSLAAAEAAMAAHAQGKFWPMHAALFAREDGEFTSAVLTEIARKVGLNMKQYEADMAARKHLDVLTGFKKQALDAGLTGTPAFYVNGRVFNMDPDMFGLEPRLEMELDRDGAGCK